MNPSDEWQGWENKFADRGVSPEIIKLYAEYVNNLLSKSLPVIFEFEHLAKLLGFTRTYLASAVNAPNKHYRQFTIPKKRGGKRQILAPYPALLQCQRWILEHILLHLPVHEAGHGFVPGRSIISNASKHLESKQILNMDLTDFFHSVKFNQVMQVFKEAGYVNNVAFYLSSLCTLNNHLPQGAATSPALSNIVAAYFDKRLTLLSSKYGLTYTRYADDLTFSGDKIPYYFSKIVQDIATDCGFTINTTKTRLASIPSRLMVTGLVIKGENLTLPREYKRELKKEVHFIQKYGYLSHISKEKIRDPLYLERLIGKCNFWLQVEPQNKNVKNYLDTLVNTKNSLTR